MTCRIRQCFAWANRPPLRQRASDEVHAIPREPAVEAVMSWLSGCGVELGVAGWSLEVDWGS